GGEVRSVLLQVSRHEKNGNPTLWIREVAMKRAYPVTRDVPLSEQQLVTLEVAVTCEARVGGKAEKGETLRRTYTVAPDPANPAVGYKVVELGPEKYAIRKRTPWAKAYQRFLYVVRKYADP